MDAFTPQQTIELVSRIGTKKAHMRLDKLFFNSVATGPFVGFGGAWLLSTNAAPWYQENAPGLIRTLGGFVFPVALIMIVLSGSDLFTSNIMFMTTALLHRRITLKDLAINWFVSFFGNLAGTLFFVTVITGYGGVFEESQAYTDAAIRLATQKAVNPGWHQIFLRAIGANWLVCFAVFTSISSREIASKILAIWWPCACFVGLALDHVVANMFFIPTGIWAGAPISVSYYIWKSMIPTALGNIVGGGFFIATAYWYLYLTGEVAVSLSFGNDPLDTAMEVGGPMRSARVDNEPRQVLESRDTSSGKTSGDSGAATPVADTVNGNADVKSMATGGSGSGLQSGLGQELSDHSPYAKTYAERTKVDSDGEKV
ncbi:hypothetical protein EJ05DRAFT_442571 [Pseudovirgaria hyperparasitica]|uniref:Formate/nitrite transporter n=1 Tax=Pseudovirgaria hyperparasitica TaxID=470096 RepID=A0A6A6VXD9_9PEZI|nr:uncharacterized protein EJ05DRAFT_442571 [Pseudovirgaria hyperparasitica]KAF2755272.1 hypothetical protein EJ05DRAFT_442571 [Pseudovirgaria hyperparasitica]